MGELDFPGVAVLGASEFGECGPSVGSGLRLGEGRDEARDGDGYADLEVSRSGSYLRDRARELVEVVEGQGPTGPRSLQGRVWTLIDALIDAFSCFWSSVPRYWTAG